LLRQAFRAATSGAPGPVHLEMRGSHGHVVEEEGELELIVEEPFKGYPAFRSEPEPEKIREAIKALAQAERPIIVAGGGVTASRAKEGVGRVAGMLAWPR